MPPNTSHMTESRRGALPGLAVALALLCLPAAAATPQAEVVRPVAAASGTEGLVRQRSHSLDEYYLRPGASFATYHKVLLAPVDVSFAKYWAREHRDIDAAESLKLRQDLAVLARDEFRRVLQQGRDGGKGYELTDAPGPGVLEVRASLVDLDIHAPEVKDAAIRRNFVLSAGEATLVAELRDSQTSTVLARVVDRREMRRYNELQYADSITNSAEARDLVAAWSRLLRRQLDSAKSDDKGS